MNPYAVPAMVVGDSGVDPTPSGPPKTPRVWTVFLTIAIALVATIGAQIVGAIAIVVVALATGTTPQELQAKALVRFHSTPSAIWASSLSWGPSQGGGSYETDRRKNTRRGTRRL